VSGVGYEVNLIFICQWRAGHCQDAVQPYHHEGNHRREEWMLLLDIAQEIPQVSWALEDKVLLGGDDG
jgi:hypothetical protein